MTTFWIAISLLFLLALIIVWYAFFAKQQLTESQTKDHRKETNVTLYHEHLKELKKDLSEGGLDQESYDQLTSELDKTLLQDVTSAAEGQIKVDKTVAPSILWPITLSIFIGAMSFFAYFQYGASDQLQQGQGMLENIRRGNNSHKLSILI